MAQTQQRDLPQRQAATQEKQQTQPASELDKLLSRSVKFTPFAESDEIELTFGQVKNFISARTKSGATASDGDIVKFMMLCKARGLNPWVGDAYLVGYDSRDSGPTFSLITSHQALLKRAEAHPAMDGMQSGVIVKTANGITEREGDLVLSGEVLVGAWAKLYRKDRSVVTYDAINLSTYDKGRSQWEKDKGGMIVKCAEASVLRKAFPSQLAGLYIQHEAAMIAAGGEVSTPKREVATPRTLSDLTAGVAVATTNDDEPDAPDKPGTKLDWFADAIKAATTEKAVRDAYEQAGHPAGDATEDEVRQMGVMMTARLEELKGGAA